MPYFPVDDDFADHPKVIAAGNAAIGLWTRTGAWAKKRATGGFVPVGTARLYGTRAEARRLVDVGLWDEVLGGYLFHDWTDYGSNETAPLEQDAAAERRAQATRRKREQRARDADRVTPRDESVTVTRDEGVTGRDESVTVTPGPSPSPVPPSLEGVTESSSPETSRVTSRPRDGVTSRGSSVTRDRTDQASAASENDSTGTLRERAARFGVDFYRVRQRLQQRAREPVEDERVMRVIIAAVGRAKPRKGDRTGLVLTSIDRDWPEWSQILFDLKEAS